MSIIVPSYNQGRYIRETLESILAQEHRPLEVLVIDGGSSDETVGVLRSFDGCPELRWWSEADSGVVEAVNKGLARARGEVAGIQSSDDAYLPGAIGAAVEALAGDPKLGLVYGDVLKVDADGREIDRTSLPPYSLEALLALETWVPQPAAFFSLPLARTLGGWREEVPYVADTDLWLRIALRRKVRKIERVLGKRRVHAAQRDRNGAAIIRDYGRMLDSVPGLADRGELRRAAAAGRLVILLRYSYGAGRLATLLRAWRLVWLRPRAAGRLRAEGLVPFFGAGRRVLRAGRAAAGGAIRAAARPDIGPRQVVGAALLDVPRLLPRLVTSSGWVGFGNRRDDLRAAPSGRGVYRTGQWSSDLHVCRVFPALGRLLMRRALGEWPISMDPVPSDGRPPEVTFVLPFRGIDRLPLLQATLASLRAQAGVAVECIVVEQDARPVAHSLPKDVRHVHLDDAGEFRKGWALNVGVSQARAPIVICHDADILAPSGYAGEALRIVGSGFDTAQLGRLLFYLDTAATQRLLDEESAPGREPPARVKQNWQGGSIVIRRDAFFGIGGFDESFTGWGGEDNEFFDRCLSRPFWRYGYLPFVHLWHADQGAKVDAEARRQAAARLEQALGQDRRERIEALRARQGQPQS